MINPIPGVPVPTRERNIFLAYTFFMMAIGFAAGFLFKMFLW